MEWVDIAPNQFVSFEDAIGSPFGTKGEPMPGIDRFMTKADVIYHLATDESYLAGYASNQWVKKSDFVAPARPKAWRGIYEYCIQDGRPTGLTTMNIKYGYYTHGNVYFPDGTFIYTTEKDYSGDYTYSGAFDCSYYGWSSGQEYAAGFDAQSANWLVGDAVYLGTNTDLELVPDGWYVVDRAYVAPNYNSFDTAHHVVGGVITEITYSPW